MIAATKRNLKSKTELSFLYHKEYIGKIQIPNIFCYASLGQPFCNS